jgi:tubulin--tyrosine ligase
MADRGMGIRLFHTKDGLQKIFESFGVDSDEEETEDEGGDASGVVASQLRHFVVQVSELSCRRNKLIFWKEYIPNPLLLDPTENMDQARRVKQPGRKVRWSKFFFELCFYFY